MRIKERYNPDSSEYEYYDEVLKNLFGNISIQKN